MDRIRMPNPIAELDGDEMTRVIWRDIKKVLLEDFVQLNTEYYDLGLEERDRTDDRVTVEAADAIARLGVGVKCATITPNAQRVVEYNLKQMWKSPNGTLRARLDGTVFRAPIMTRNIKPCVGTWTKPIIIARHAYGDIYSATDVKVDKGVKAELALTYADGHEERLGIHDFAKDGGIVCGMHNTEGSISAFARSCFTYALDTGLDLWFSTKDTISKKYDHTFKDIFAKIYEEEYRALFEKAGIQYFYTLIDDAVARVIRSEGGFIWALKNYDGDVMSDMVATAFGSLSMMTSVLVSPEGKWEFEAAHGTVTRHYYKYLKGEKTSTNPVATIFAWSGALKKRAEMDSNTELMRFACTLEESVTDTIESGIMTGDLARVAEGKVVCVDTDGILAAIRANLERKLNLK